ncbi:hypothetical protein EST38_g1630 [Candolleomyces aberdarensis]|uniref:Uncharacterized protein n=1 Tax=Candolleomyces aberdarensis TaxID=2316362 RepID=A0A4Q2DYW9_9AGAR|nr:hypothetical protein EST38_g1630 [Candolleomyces aberdarensis]
MIKIGRASLHVKYVNVLSVTLLVCLFASASTPPSNLIDLDLAKFYDLLLTLDLEVSSSSGIFGKCSHSHEDSDLPVPSVHGCNLSGGTPLLFLAFVLLLLHEVIVMVITLVIGFRKYLNLRTPLIRTLYRDGTIFFVLIFLVSLANIVNLAAGVPEYLDLFTT